MKAAHTPRTVVVNEREISLEPGQFVTGRFALEEEFNRGSKPSNRVSGISLMRHLDSFASLEMLNIKKTTKYTLVTVLNWNMYQGFEQPTDIKLTSNRHQTDTNKNVKNVNNDNNSIGQTGDLTLPTIKDTSMKPTFFTTIKINGKERPDPNDESHPFNVFWNEYPRRVKRIDAERSFKRNVKDWKTMKAIIVNIKQRLHSGQWELTDDRVRYIPHPTTYLNNLMWEDEVPVSVRKNVAPVPEYDDHVEMSEAEEKALREKINKMLEDLRERKLK